MKKIIILSLICLFLFPKNIYAKTENDENTSESDLTPNATSAIMIEASTGEILYEKNANEKLAPASMTKMMSMLLIMEQIEKGTLSWDEQVTVSENASSMGGSQIFLETGEKMSVQDLLKGISIASGNDATVAMAERIAGSEDAFVKMMNERAKELGLTSTNFKNATGLDDENHYSSAHDMAMIAKELVKHDKILEFTGTYEDYLRQNTDKSFWLVNTNKLVRYYQGVDGLKTGFTNTAGYCLTSTALRDDLRLITVVMNEPDPSSRSKETSALLDYGFNLYQMNNILSKDTIIGKVKVDLGQIEEVEVIPTEDVKILSKKNETSGEITYEKTINKLKAPIKQGDIIGNITILEDGNKIKTIDLTVQEDVSKVGFFKALLRNYEDILKGNMNI